MKAAIVLTSRSPEQLPEPLKEELRTAFSGSRYQREVWGYFERSLEEDSDAVMDRLKSLRDGDAVIIDGVPLTLDAIKVAVDLLHDIGLDGHCLSVYVYDRPLLTALTNYYAEGYGRGLRDAERSRMMEAMRYHVFYQMDQMTEGRPGYNRISGTTVRLQWAREVGACRHRYRHRSLVNGASYLRCSHCGDLQPTTP